LKNRLPKLNVIKSINSHLLTLLPLQEQHDVDELPATDLLRGERFDVMAKYIYAKLRLLNAADGWRSKVYYELQKVFGGFKEGDGSGKNSYRDYVNAFDNLLNSMIAEGFKNKEGFLPIGNDNIIIDGAHRLAASLLLGQCVPVIRFNIEPAKYDYKYFLARGLAPEVADAMALEFCRLSPNMVIAVVFPVAHGRDHEILEILSDYGQIIYEKQVVFSEIGRHNLIRQLYRNESWLGMDGEITPGLRHHVDQRFLNNRPTKFYFFVCMDLSKLKQAKARVRALFDLKNDSIHINDTYEETIRIAEQILTPNSIHFLNHAQPWVSRAFVSMFREYQTMIKQQGLDREKFCIDSGSVLAVYGLRDTNDLDYLHLGDEIALTPDSKISDHATELIYHGITLGDLLFDPENYFYYDGMKFVALGQLRKMKASRNEAKDIRDVFLIDSLSKDISNFYKLRNKLRFWVKKIYEMIVHFELWQLKLLLPESLHPIARFIYHAPFFIREILRPKERQIKYKGFILYYGRGTCSIVSVYTGKTYKPELTWKILETLKKKENPVFLDIGADNGLIIFNILASLPHTQIFVVEPNRYQYSLLKKTILCNKLEHQICLSGESFGFQMGEAYANLDNTKNAHDDSFFETGRPGVISKTKIDINTLDQWWLDANKPRIDVVKINAEYAYRVLIGAVTFLQECRPVIFLETSRYNLKLLNYLNECGYELLTLNGVPVSPNQMGEVMQPTQVFMASYRL